MKTKLPTAEEIFKKHLNSSGLPADDFDYKFIIDAMEEYGQQKYEEGYDNGTYDESYSNSMNYLK